MATIQIADKPTLDEVNDKCDDILDAVTGDETMLSKVRVYVGDFVHDTLIVTYGGVNTVEGYIST